MSIDLKMPNPMQRLPALAERLGVEPVGSMSVVSDRVIVSAGDADGRCYDLFDLIEAMLDRCDAAITAGAVTPERS